jgi:pyrimidine oxygenase
MRFGVFLPNGRNGYILSKAAPLYMPTFKHNLAITQEAERQGLDFVLSMIKFRGFGGETGFWDACLDSINLTSALAAATSKIELVATISLLSTHPAVAARMIATLDDISGGRGGLNIVTGWNRAEYAQMGLWPGDHYYEQRYEFADEYLSICRSLWRTGRVDHDGKFFQLKDCVCEPRPQREIPIVCAGQSPQGVRFTAEHGDHNFVMSSKSGLKRITQNLGEAAVKAGRKVGTYALFVMVAAETDAEAHAQANAILEGADTVAIGGMLGSAALDTVEGGSSNRLREALGTPLDEGNMAFLSFPALIGSYQSVAQQIDAIEAECGIEGMLLTFPDFVQGTRDFGSRVRPLLRGARAETAEHIAA